MLIKTKIRLFDEIHVIVHKNGDLLPAAFDEIKKVAGSIRRLRDVGAKKLIAEMELGYEIRVEIISSRKLHNK